MQKKVLFIGKETFGKKKFITKSDSNYNHYNVNYSDFFSKISRRVIDVAKENASNQLVCLKPISYKDFHEMGNDYLPNILTLTDASSSLYSYKNVFSSNLQLPSVDCVVWEKNLEVNVMTFSRMLTTLFFETENGKFALATLHREILLYHPNYFFNKLFEALEVSDNNKLSISIISCPEICYEDNMMTIEELLVIKFSCYENINNVFKVINTHENNNVCYECGEDGNHVVIIY